MKAIFVYSTKYIKCNDLYYATSQTADVWQERYLNIFDHLTVVGRLVESEDIKGKSISSCDNVDFHCTKLAVNPMDYFLKRREIEEFISNEVKNADFVIARQSYFSAVAVEFAKKYHKPYVVEVVGSTWDANWNYSLKGKIVAPYFELQAKKMIKDAPYVVYVTQSFLQKIYSTSGKTIGISNVKIPEIDENVMNNRLRRIDQLNERVFSLCTVAAVDVKYKGQAYVLDAMRKLKKDGYLLKYYIVGSGNQERLRKIADDYGIADDVIFTGSIPHDDVKNILDTTDVYIQPSLQEGLPRAMIEGMSRGMPAIGFATAGIPELIEPEYVCRRKSVEDICTCLRRLTLEEMKRQGRRNYEKSKDYLFSKLNADRELFFKEAISAQLKKSSEGLDK